MNDKPNIIFILSDESEAHRRKKCEHLKPNSALVHDPYHRKWIKDFE